MRKNITIQILVSPNKQILKKAMIEEVNKGEILPINKYQFALLKRNNIKFKIV